MTDPQSAAVTPATEAPAASAPAAPAVAVPVPVAAAPTEATGASPAGSPDAAPQEGQRPPSSRSRRGGRGGRGGGGNGNNGANANANANANTNADTSGSGGNGRRNGGGGGGGGRGPRRDTPAGGGAAQQQQQQRTPRAPHPVLEQLAGLYPRLFGAVAVPLKRGVFQDLLDAHPEVFERDGLKAALGLHTRSTRYLQGVATGQQRCDLQGQPVEALAPDHIYHALVELWRRREGRTPEAERAALRDHWRSRIARAFEASGLERTAYAERMRNRDEVAGVMLDEALAEAAGHAARDEALLRAFEASGGTVETFADTYGLDPRVAGRTLDHARRRRAIAQQQPETPAA